MLYICTHWIFIAQIMTQILVTLENNADSKLIKNIIENIKGVLKTSLWQHETNSKEWIDKVKALSNSIDSSIIDWNDERTKYIMSK